MVSAWARGGQQDFNITFFLQFCLAGLFNFKFYCQQILGREELQNWTFIATGFTFINSMSTRRRYTHYTFSAVRSPFLFIEKNYYSVLNHHILPSGAISQLISKILALHTTFGCIYYGYVWSRLPSTKLYFISITFFKNVTASSG